ncbi:hypothetical protein DFH09DRAFT_1078734 [Mycena vulgaris]|nr:hypothetical protein DFH09DRAFT_1078734 [Mycena vulgaris]
MANQRKAEQRQPREKRPNAGRRKAAKKQDQNDKPSSSPPGSPPLRPCARPRNSVTKQPSISQSHQDVAELLMGLGGPPPCNLMNAVFDKVLGLTPEESAQLDTDQLRKISKSSNISYLSLTNDEEYTIIYDVPYKNATRELSLTSTTSYGAFLTALAGKMDVSITHLSAIGYIPSYKPVPKLLETSTDYERLMEDIAAYCKTCSASKSGKVKPFSIALSDTSAAPADGRFKAKYIQEERHPACGTTRGDQDARAQTDGGDRETSCMPGTCRKGMLCNRLQGALSLHKQ